MDQGGNSHKDKVDPEAMVEDFAQRHFLNHILMEYSPLERDLAGKALLIAFSSDRRKGEAGRDDSYETHGEAQGSGSQSSERSADTQGPVQADADGVCKLGHAETHMVTMADGTRLATDVLMPERNGPWPVVLTRTPYNKALVEYLPFIRAGFAAVIQDARGRFASEGENVPFIGCGWEKHQDGLETVRWIRKQPWCNGRIATHGGSANAITQNYLAGAGPLGLDAQYILSASASFYHDVAYIGGAFHLSLVCIWSREIGFHPDALAEFRSHTAYDDFWRKYDTSLRYRQMDAPAMHVGGWFDIFCQGTIDAFSGRRANGGKASDKQVLVMGPWSHGTFQQSQVGELFFPNAAIPEGYGDMEWLARHLKGETEKPLKPVVYYVMGDVTDSAAPGNGWRHAEDWPPPAREIPFYLHADGRISEEPPDSASAERGYAIDPSDPCLTLGGANLVLPSGPMDQSSVEARDDVLVFTGAPLEEPLEVTGRIKAMVFVSSSAVDTDISIRLCDVYPDGASYLLAEGIRRLRFRETFERPKPLEPSAVYPVEVDCWSTSIVFNRGHRVRVSVTSSNFPRFDLNPGTGNPWKAGCRYEIQRNTVHCSSRYPSRVLLPVAVH